MKEYTLLATIEALDQVQGIIDQELDTVGANPEVKIQLAICVEELYVNIAHYAYRPRVGELTIRYGVTHDPCKISIQFEDGGVPFDPLAKKDPDITLSEEERDVGGLGIFMVKNAMDRVDYAYKNGKNILTIEKNLA